jgi:hypothetical protein
MELTIKDIQSIAHGALRVEKTAQGEIALYRFTKKQMALYERVNTAFFEKSVFLKKLNFGADRLASPIFIRFYILYFGYLNAFSVPSTRLCRAAAYEKSHI